MSMKQGRMLRIGAKLAEGQVFEVFELLEYPSVPIGSRLVLKKIRPALAQDAAFRNRLHKLFEVLPRLRHPYAEEVLDAQSGGPDDTFLVCERLDGETLASLLRRECRMPLAAGRQLARQIAEAVIAGHASCIVHGNLTPSHIVITQPRRDDPRSPLRIKVRGFGLAPPLGGALFGTPSYLAPEQVDSLVPHPHATVRSDQHALAVLIYEALVGRFLFPRGNLETVRPKLLRQDPPYFELRGVGPAEVRRVNHALQRALAKGPASRYHELIDFIDALDGNRVESLMRPIYVAPVAPPQVAPPPPALRPEPALRPPAPEPPREEPMCEEDTYDYSNDSQTLPVIRQEASDAIVAPRRLRQVLPLALALALGLLSWAFMARVGRGEPVSRPPSKPQTAAAPPKQAEVVRVPAKLEEPATPSDLEAEDPPPPKEEPFPRPVRRKPPRQRSGQFRQPSGYDNNPDVQRVASCLNPKLARELDPCEVRVLFSHKARSFVVDAASVSDKTREALEQCLHRLVAQNPDFSFFPNTGVIWSCR